MNTYVISFYFRGSWEICELTADQISLKLLESTFGESVYSIHDEHPEQYFEHKFWVDGQQYTATLSLFDAGKINVYEVGEEEILAESDIPYIVLVVKNGDEVIYKLSDYII